LNKKILFSFIATVIAVGGLFLAPVAEAAPATTHSNPFSNLVQMIAQKFGLDQNSVQDVVNQAKAQNQAKRQQNMQNRENTRLDKLVSAGKITAAQKQSILDEIAKLQSEYPMSSFKTMTADQRKQTIQKMQAEISSWSSSTGIDKKYLLPLGAFGMGMRRGWFKNVTPTPTI